MLLGEYGSRLWQDSWIVLPGAPTARLDAEQILSMDCRQAKKKCSTWWTCPLEGKHKDDPFVVIALPNVFSVMSRMRNKAFLLLLLRCERTNHV